MLREADEYTRQKPRFASPTEVEAALTAVPPFSFHNVTARVLPLAANISSLRLFCDSYLNMDIPRRIVRFQPFIPYVYLVILDYGDMTVNTGHRFWVSQREVSFVVPLERYKEVDGKLVFQDLALVHPFIYVDDEWSLNTGREVYGWPKVFATMDADVNLWTKNPRSRTKLLTLSTSVFPETYANQALTRRTLLEVYSQPELSFAQLPLDALNPLNPVVAFNSALTSSLTLAKDVADSVFRSNLRGFEPAHSLSVLRQMFGYGLDRAKGVLPEQLLAQFARNDGDGSGTGSASRPRLMVNNVNLKQYRDAEYPDVPCYQELNYSVMGVTNVNRAGVLGDMRMLAGDLSGGYRVALHRYASQPIIETLGLEVDESQEADGVTRSILKPTLPFWCDVEFLYGGGKPLCWRSAEESEPQDNYWKANRRADTPVSDPPTPDEEQRKKRPVYLDPATWRDVHSAVSSGGQVLYNTARGAALQAIPGPFEYPDVTARVFPLLADKSRLRELCSRYLTATLDDEVLDEDDMTFEPFGTYVYLTVTNFGTEYGAMWSEANNIGAWKDREVKFHVPVKWYKKGKEGLELLSVASVSPFSFANTNAHVDSDREITGRRTEKATIETPPGNWLGESGPSADSTLLTLSTELLPALGVGQQAVERTLLEIVTSDVLPANDLPSWRHVSELWGEKLVKELRRKTELRREHEEAFLDLKAASLGILTSKARFNEVILRQCRDSQDPFHASFQALLLEQSTVKEIYDVREIEEKIHVAIHLYPSHPIVETLGLQCKKVSSTGDSVVQYLQPVRPFWVRFGMGRALARTVARREGARWEQPHLERLFSAGDDDGGDVSQQRQMMNFGREFSEELMDRTTMAAAEAAKVAGEKAAAREADRWMGSAGVEREGSSVLGEPPAGSPQAEERGRIPKWVIDEYERWVRQGKVPLAPFRLRDQLKNVAPPSADAVRGIVNRASPPPITVAKDPPSEGVGDAARPSEVVEPQMILESILSDEWEHWGDPRWFRGEAQKPEFCIPLEGTVGANAVLEDISLKQWRQGLSQVCKGWLSVPEPTESDSTRAGSLEAPPATGAVESEDGGGVAPEDW